MSRKKRKQKRRNHLHNRPDNPATGLPFDHCQAWVKLHNRTAGKTLYVPTLKRRDRVLRRVAWPWYGKELKVWGLENGYTMTQLAREFGCRPDYYRKIVRADSVLPYGTYLALRYLIIRDRNRKCMQHSDRVKRQLKQARRLDEERRARRAQIREGGGLESSEEDYL